MKDCINIKNKKDCCGCGACVNICPKGAIDMKEDEAGFIFPAVDKALCIECGRCVSVCVFNEKARGAADGEPEVFAAVYQDRTVLEESSSGGVFTSLARAVLDKGGAVFGAAWTDDLGLEHICVQTEHDLKKLRGSKYVQSDTKKTFQQVRQMLKAGRPVCYCGTPCQIAGLKAFLGKDDENLLTVDIICHGVPSIRMLRDDLKAVAGDRYDQISDVRFRDKRRGWTVKGSVITGDKRIKYDPGTSPYYFFFLKGEIYRESCYNCRFPQENRQGDITLGDYWGIRSELIRQLGDVNPDKGISCVLVNTPKGRKWFDAAASSLSVAPSSRANAEKRNGQLTHSSQPLPEHKMLLDGYIQKGHAAVEEGYKKHTKDHIVRFVKNMIPAKIKRKLKDVLSN